MSIMRTRLSRLTSYAAVAAMAAVLLVPAACRSGAGNGAATIAEKLETIRTYPYSDPDPVPIFVRSSMWGQGQRLYPYFFYNRFSAKGEDRDWTVVRLENPYISVAVLPQVGGKVWGAVDKASGREFLYTNHVIKFREIALRGPWTSGGIEFNFGIVGHAPSTASPVDYVTRRNPDGSVSCVVGTMDLPSRTRWSVTISLPKDKAAFETNGFWHNPTPFSQSYYYWSCAAIKTAEDLRYVFPGRFFIGHDYAVPLESWPVDRTGRDLSWYRNNDSPGSKSYFTVGEYADFYGAWYEKADAGFGHWARYDDMPGRKVWIWDLSRQGEIWVDLLTDKDGQYSEPQAGRLLNQSDHGLLKPSVTDRWKELWFPYRGIGQMKKASPIGVLSVDRSADGAALTIGFFPTQAVDEEITVATAGAVVFKDRLRLAPQEKFAKEIRLAATGAGAAAGAIEVRIGSDCVWTSDPEAAKIGRPLKFRAVDESTPEGLYLAGLRLEQERQFHQALEKYEACLAHEPIHLRALCRAAELTARRGEYEKGLAFAAKALENGMYDPEANYIYGVIARRLGRLVDAKETLGWAARSMEFRSAAYVQMAEIAVLEKNYGLAVEYAAKALDANRFDSSAYEITAAAYRKMGKKEEAARTIDRLLDFDPLDHLGRCERWRLEPGEATLAAFKSMIRNELPHENYLEIAMFYARIGCADDAAAVLEQAPEHAEVDAWLAYLARDVAPDKSRVRLDKAMARSPLLVFPFREESIPVFEWAMAQRPEDWKPAYYLGLIYWGKGRIDETLKLFEAVKDADFAPFYMARGYLYREKEPAKALADYVRATEVDPKNWRGWHTLVEDLLASAKTGEALERARQAARLFPDDVPVAIDLVRALMADGLYEEAGAVMEKVRALPYEGASEIHGLYVEAHVGAALERMRKSEWLAALEHLEKAKLYPETLGTGAPFEPDVRVEDYLGAICQEKLENSAKAAELRKAIVDYTLAHWDERGPGAYFGGVLLEKAGQKDKARELLKAVPPPTEILKKLGSNLVRPEGAYRGRGATPGV